jgi:ketosteroid isomerase-like protein
MASEPSHNDVERLTELRNEYVEAENAGDVDGILETCRSDIVFIPPESPPVRGSDASRAFLSEFLDAFDVTIELSREAISVAGDFAYEWGTVSGTITPPDGQNQPVRNSYLIVYKRDSDGAWGQSKHVWNANE